MLRNDARPDYLGARIIRRQATQQAEQVLGLGVRGTKSRDRESMFSAREVI